MGMRHLRLDSVLSVDKEEIPVADRTISRDRLNAHCGNSKVATHVAVWSLISSFIDVRFHFSAGACEVRAGNNSQCNLGGTT